MDIPLWLWELMDKCHWLLSQWHLSIIQGSKSVIDRGQWHKKMSLTVSILSNSRWYIEFLGKSTNKSRSFSSHLTGLPFPSSTFSCRTMTDLLAGCCTLGCFQNINIDYKETFRNINIYEQRTQQDFLLTTEPPSTWMLKVSPTINVWYISWVRNWRTKLKA